MLYASHNHVGGTSTQITFDNSVNVDQSLKSEIQSIFKSSTGTNEVELSDVEGENAILVKTKNSLLKKTMLLQKRLYPVIIIYRKVIFRQKLSVQQSAAR